MIWVRIYSSMIDDGEHQPNKKEVVVILTRLTSENKIDREVQGFGYLQEWTEESKNYLKYPFIFQIENTKNEIARLNYEGWDQDDVVTTNIVNSEITENVIFALYSGNKEYTYRIDQVTQL